MGHREVTPSHTKSDVLIHYACPKCQYDVTRTLMDDITVCPECGGAISEAVCSAPRPPSWRLFGVWKSIVLIGAILVGAYAFNVGFIHGLLPKLGGTSFMGLSIDNDLMGFAKLGMMIIASELVCYWVWWSVERKRDRGRAAMRALGATILIILGQLALMGSCAWVLAAGMGV